MPPTVLGHKTTVLRLLGRLLLLVVRGRIGSLLGVGLGQLSILRALSRLRLLLLGGQKMALLAVEVPREGLLEARRPDLEAVLGGVVVEGQLGGRQRGQQRDGEDGAHGDRSPISPRHWSASPRQCVTR
uniref:(northern house mosquito) hypothetical protein n=1 Tax=Culex pipiens TaxID=7175 RepID=A0A8D8DHK1_CULPI